MMLQKSLLAYITSLWLLFQLLIEINCQTTSFVPERRYAHTATFINDKLYILGGYTIDNTGSDFFYLDFSVAFSTNKIPWKDLSSTNIVPPHFGATAVKGGANNNTLFLYGGLNFIAEVDLVYIFDPQNNSWNTQEVAGAEGANLVGITDDHGKMYLWSGLRKLGNDVNDMIILDTLNLDLKKGNLDGAPSPRQSYGAVLLPNNYIIYMGGYNVGNDTDLTLNQIYIYDTINDTWSNQTTTGTVPSARDGFSAVLGLDGQSIIIFGGTTKIYGQSIKPEDSLYVLNLINLEWSIPKVTGPIPSVRSYHKANVIEKYMVISFGGNYSESTENDILLLDISNDEEYIWTEDFEPSSLAPNPVNASKPTKTNMIGVIIGSFIGGILLFIGIFLLHKWYKNRQKEDTILTMPVNEDFKYNQDNSVSVISIGKTRFSMANNSSDRVSYTQ